MGEMDEPEYTAEEWDAALTAAEATELDRVAEAGIRPGKLDDVIGQTRVREQIGLLLEGARRRGAAPDHLLLSGPPGLGKTTLAMIVATELGVGLRQTSGPAIEHSAAPAAIPTSLAPSQGL